MNLRFIDATHNEDIKAEEKLEKILTIIMKKAKNGINKVYCLLWGIAMQNVLAIGLLIFIPLIFSIDFIALYY